METRPGYVAITATLDNVTTLNATLMKGQTGECPIDRAKELIGKGEATLVDGEIDIPGVGTVKAGEQRGGQPSSERAINPAAARRAERR
jgi:hypothetical protein